jgi:general secretion pathway protein G
VQAVRGAVTLYLANDDASRCPTMQELIAGKLIDASTSTQDAWNHDFVIACEGSELSVRSAGPDGELETADDIPMPKRRS